MAVAISSASGARQCSSPSRQVISAHTIVLSAGAAWGEKFLNSEMRWMVCSGSGIYIQLSGETEGRASRR